MTWFSGLIQPILFIKKDLKNFHVRSLITEIGSVLCRWHIRKIHQRVSLRLLHVRIDSFRVFSEYVSLLSVYSETILCITNNSKIHHIFHIPLNTFRVFSKCALILFVHSPFMLQYFLHILQISRKHEEYAEKNVHSQQCLGTLRNGVSKQLIYM